MNPRLAKDFVPVSPRPVHRREALALRHLFLLPDLGLGSFVTVGAQKDERFLVRGGRPGALGLGERAALELGPELGVTPAPRSPWPPALGPRAAGGLRHPRPTSRGGAIPGASTTAGPRSLRVSMTEKLTHSACDKATNLRPGSNVPR